MNMIFNAINNLKKLCKANKMKHFTLQILQHFYNAVEVFMKKKCLMKK